MHCSVKLVDTGELKTKVVTEVVAEIAVEVATEVLVELTASRLGYYLQIWLVMPVV